MVLFGGFSLHRRCACCGPFRAGARRGGHPERGGRRLVMCAGGTRGYKPSGRRRTAQDQRWCRLCHCGCCVAGSGAVSGAVSGLQHHLGEVGLPHAVARVVWVSRAVDLQVAAAERQRLGLPRCGSLQQPRWPADPCCPTTKALSRVRPVVQVADAGPDGSCEHCVGHAVAAGDVGARGGLCGGVRGLQVRRLPLHRTFPPWGRVCSLNEESAVVI